VRILHVWRRAYPFDIRVCKINHTLAQAGHEVHLLAANGGDQPAREQTAEITIHRLPALRGMLRPLSRPSGYPTAINPRWRAALSRACAEVRPEALLVRDVQLMSPCVALRNRLGIPLVLDLPENWPAVIRIWRATEGMTLRNVLTRSPRLFARAERRSARAADHVLVCVEEMAARAARLGAPPERISLVRNTPDLDLFPRMDDGQARRAAEIRDRMQSSYVIIYAGEIDLFRGLEVLVRAVARLRRTVPDVRLYCVGPSKPASLRVIRRAVSEQRMEEAVVFTGWLDQPEMLDYIAASDVGASPLHWCEQLETTLSNKLFDYMSLGKPFVATDAGPIRRLAEECDCGLLAPSGDDAALAEALAALADTALRRRLGERGLQAVREKYHWGLSDGPAVAQVFARLERGNRSLSPSATME
jgi:glycosyltransferase involved in cell wall biosynthesis